LFTLFIMRDYDKIPIKGDQEKVKTGEKDLKK